MCLLLSATDANEEEMSFGSLCGGGRYDDLVASFDPKGQFKVFKDVCCLTGMITSHVLNTVYLQQRRVKLSQFLWINSYPRKFHLAKI